MEAKIQPPCFIGCGLHSFPVSHSLSSHNGKYIIKVKSAHAVRVKTCEEKKLFTLQVEMDLVSFQRAGGIHLYKPSRTRLKACRPEEPMKDVIV